MDNITKQETRAEKVAALATAQEKAFNCKTREKIGVVIHGQQCKFTFLWISGAFCATACINTTDFQKQLFSIRAKLPAYWLLNITQKTVNQVLRQAQKGQSVKFRTTEKPQNPHTEQKII